MTELEKRIGALAEDVCRKNNLHVIEVEVKGDRKTTVFRVYADSEQGITLGECEMVSRLMMDQIDMDDAFPENYRLDVSSPGLDRPLKSDFDFRKNIGKDLRVTVREPEKTVTYTGELVRFDAGHVWLKKGGEEVCLCRPDIQQAKIQLKW